MGIQIEKHFEIDAPRDAVWGFLTDPHRVASCLPGAAVTDQVDDQTYAGTMTVKVGPVTASYKGSVRFERLDAEAGEAEIVASGQDVRGKGGATMRMRSVLAAGDGGGTSVTVTSDVNVTGMLAQFGRGMINDVSDHMFAQFTGEMRKQLEAGGPAAEAPGEPEAPPEGSPAQEPAAPAAPASLDVVALGAQVGKRAAGRLLRSPAFWGGVAVVAFALYWLVLR